MNNLTIPIEIIGGTTFKDAINDAKKLADVLGNSVKFVTFEFNDRHICVSQFANIRKMVKDYKDGRKYIPYS